MAHTPADSRIKMDSSLEDKVRQATSTEQISQILQDAMKSQGLIQVDQLNPEVFYEVEQPQPTAYARTVTINGKKLVFEGATEAEAIEKENALYRQAFAQPAATEPARDEHGRFVERQPVDDATELASQAAATLTEKHLTALGIDPDVMRETSNQAFSNRWVNGSIAFQRQHPEWEKWASEENKNILGRLVAENDLIDSADPAAALAAAFEFGIKEGLFSENDESVFQRELATCQTSQELDACLAKWRPNSRGAASLRYDH